MTASQVLCRAELQPHVWEPVFYLLAFCNAESLGLSLRRLVPFHLRGVSPQAFQSVVLTGSSLEEMDDDVAVIEEDPFRLGFAFVAQGLQVEVFPETLFYALGESLDMGT